ncbi:TetR/AcrR family transcriptional regulator [Hoyosella sp. G463]|uniref:TetR/AcrR family transcriptional regulator n=1 Tax=Lolliginicoccus lacisalsi TaxID=2742202 RepID=A0A927JA33_9ACTN|nr:TetR/AcrR family transcriptional regulator [Lolliginicoccus lacisalsi]MBD8505481.1 TetR/AcrR family transcriptional regulator [Lolliginicoccus lacisalsi]
MSIGRHRSINEDAVLDAARDCVLAVGWKRTTLTDVARRAGVSRMSIYRKWNDMRRLMSDVMTREWTSLPGIEELLGTEGHHPARAPRELATELLAITDSLRENSLFAKVMDVDPEIMLTYIIQRRGRTQNWGIAVFERMIRHGQAAGTLRDGDAAARAHTILLLCQSWLVSAPIMAGPPSLESLRAEQIDLLTRYLAPSGAPTA